MPPINRFTPGCCCDDGGPDPPPPPCINGTLCIYVFDYHAQCAAGEIGFWPQGVDPDTLGHGVSGQTVTLYRTYGTNHVEISSTTTDASGKACFTISPFIANPSTAPSASVGADGSAIPAGSYDFKYTWIDADGKETAASAASDTLTVGSNKRIDLTFSVKPTWVSAIRLYIRKNSSGKWHKYFGADFTSSSVTITHVSTIAIDPPLYSTEHLGSYKIVVDTSATPCADIIDTTIRFTRLCETIKKPYWLCCQKHTINVIDNDSSDPVESTVSCNSSTPDGEWHNVFGTCNATDRTTDVPTHCYIPETTEYFGTCGANMIDCNIPGFSLTEDAPLYKRASAGGEWIRVCACKTYDYETDMLIPFVKPSRTEYIPKRLYVTFTGGAGPQAILGSYYNTPIAVDWLPDSSDGGIDKPGSLKFESGCLPPSGAKWYYYYPFWYGNSYSFAEWDESSEALYQSASVELYLRNYESGSGTSYLRFSNYYFANCDPTIPYMPPRFPGDLGGRPAGEPWCLQKNTCYDYGNWEARALSTGWLTTSLPIASCAPFFYSVENASTHFVDVVGTISICVGCGYCTSLDCATEHWGVTITE